MSSSSAGRNLAPESISETAAPHPEEMKAAVDLAIGRSVTIRATARATPAGLLAAALLITAILVPVIWLTRTYRVTWLGLFPATIFSGRIKRAAIGSGATLLRSAGLSCFPPGEWQRGGRFSPC
jgi:hypothetical protein